MSQTAKYVNGIHDGDVLYHLWASAGFFPGLGKFIGVARIFSGDAFFSFKKL